MKAPRFRIFSLMAIVGVVALNLGAARVLMNYDGDLLLGVALSAIAVQVGAFLAIRSRARSTRVLGRFRGARWGRRVSYCWALFDEDSLAGSLWNE